MGQARIDAASGASIRAVGEEAYALWALTNGQGEAGVVSAARVEVVGDATRALVAVTNNDDLAYAIAQSGSVISAEGADSRGIFVNNRGAEQLARWWKRRQASRRPVTVPSASR